MPVLQVDGPSGDGALFYAMARDLQLYGAIPLRVSFNGGYLPFVYPPGAFILASTISSGTGIDLLVLFRLLPLLYFALCAALLCVFVWRAGGGNIGALVAGLMFVAADQLPFQQLAGGGGVARGLGFLLALLAWWHMQTMIETGRARTRTGILAGLALLCHPSNAAFLPIIGLGLWVDLRSRKALIDLVIAGLIAAACCAPYLLMALSRHGLEPFIRVLAVMSSTTTTSDAASYLLFTVTGYRAPYLWARLLAPLSVFGVGIRPSCALIFILLLLSGQAYQVSWVFALLTGLGVQSCIDLLRGQSWRHWRWLPLRLLSFQL